ncbi:MAG: hypothetical protein Q4C64_04390 [Erysipelotrichia bacterium]|nr:hypothetical protein [Erysipelotrichia bacterium]
MNNVPLYVFLTLLITVFILVVITPTNKDGKLNKFFQLLHNFFNFKKIYIIFIIKAIVVFLTVFSVVFGIRLMFGIGRPGYYYVSTFWYGLGLLVLGPIAVRISYETLWLAISSALATIQIRDKLYNKNNTHVESNFDEQMNAAERFGNKVYEKTKKFSDEAIEAAGKKINELKENKQNKEDDKPENDEPSDNKE